MKGSRIIAALAGLALLAAGGVAAATDRRVGPHDVATIFYVSKSDDRNRVDYGVHLDARCRPVGEEPVFAYWHRFEPGEPRFGDLNFFDEQAYGITSQRVASSNGGGTWIEIETRAAPGERLLVLVTRARDGEGCVARLRMRLSGRHAWVERAHVQLAGPMQVESITFYGTEVGSGTRIRHRRAP